MKFSLKSKKFQSQILSLLILIIFFYGGIKLLGTNKSPTTNIIKNENVIDPEEISNPTITLDSFARNSIVNGKIVWELTGDIGKYFEDSLSAKIQNPKLLYYKDTEIINLSAETAIVYFEGQSIKLANLKDNVIINEPNYILKTSDATFYQQKNEIIAPKNVKIESEKFEIIGDDLKVNTDSQDVFYNANVKSKIYNVSIKTTSKSDELKQEDQSTQDANSEVPKESVIFIDSVKFQMNNNTGVFSYQENVVAFQNEFSVKADFLNGKLITSVSPDQQGVQDLKAVGNVIITQGQEMTAYSDYADFDLEKKIVTLTGNPKVERIDNIISADIIYYYLDEERSVAEGEVEVLMKEEAK